MLCRGRPLHGSLGLNSWNGHTSPEFTALCEYTGGPRRFGCRNGETVEAAGVSGDTVELRYKGALHRRSLRDVGVTLLPLAEQPPAESSETR